MQGAGNAIAYGWSPLTRRVWSTACPTLCGWAAADAADARGATRPEQGVVSHVEISPALEGESMRGVS